MKKTLATLIALAGTGLLAGAVLLVDWNAPPWAQAVDSELGPDTGPHQMVPGASQTTYTCSMHPEVIRHEPGNCPICGMKLVRGADSAARASAQEASLRGGGVRVSPNFLQNFAVRTTEVQRGPLTVSVRAVGILDHDEARLVSVNTKFDGWIEQARVNNIGQSVTKGDVLFEVYSPGVTATQREYLATMEYVKRLRQGEAYPEAVARAESLLAAARERLRNWDVAGQQIDALETAGQAPRTVQVIAPVSGIIVAKTGDSLEGMRLSPGMTVLKIADHSTLWAKADFYAEDMGRVREGSPVSVEVDAFPGLRRDGRILFFRSAVNPETRALTAFVEVANPNLDLRPMMDVTVSVRVVVTTDAVLTPVESVLHSGERSLVIVARDDGLFESRAVQVGAIAEGMQEAVSGLAAGERVVVSSQFLIDSESNLQAAMSQLLNDGASPDHASGAAGTHRH